MTRIDPKAFNLPHVYSLAGYTLDGIHEEIFLYHEDSIHPNEFEALVINAVGKLQQTSDPESLTIHDVSKFLEKKFDFHRFSFYTCAIWDRERNTLCETSIRG